MPEPYDLSGKRISFTYDRLLQIDPDGNVYDGLGNPVTFGAYEFYYQADQPSPDPVNLGARWLDSDTGIESIWTFDGIGFLWVPVNSGGTGTSGTSGSSGTSGVGTSGTSGISGTSGTSGVNGTSGTSGVTGNNGTSGTSGINGTSGSSGTSGTDGTSGTSGIGVSGTSGSSGTSGIGLSGTSGTSGVDGTSGTSGVAGTSGTSGLSGNNGTSGTSGVGTSGTSGTSGEVGPAGPSEYSIAIFIDATPDKISTGSKGIRLIPYDCQVDEWYVTSNETGSIEFDIKRSTFSDYPTTTSIVGVDYPNLVNQSKNLNDTVSWTALSAGDILEFWINSADVQTVNLFLKISRI